MTAEVKAVAVYARVSTDRQETANQLLQLREFASRQGWRIIAEFVDTVSGSGKVKRPQFDKMMLAASQKQFDLLLFWRLDRLSREGVRMTLTYLERLDGWGAMKDVVLSIMACMAQQERIAISERTKAGLARAVKAGKTLGRPEVKVDVKKARQMQREGLGLRPIASKLKISVNSLRRALGA